MGKEAQCVDTIDSFLIQSSRPECHASEVFGVKKNQALNVGYEQVQSGLGEKTQEILENISSSHSEGIR